MNTFTCQQCHKEKPLAKKCYGYEKALCGTRCFKAAGKSYKPNGATNRGGGVGFGAISI